MTAPPRVSRYVALGSSFAAGPGIKPPASGRPAKARQSDRNYPHLLAHRFGFDLTDVTSSGSTADQILRSPQFGQPAQITAVTAQTALVTVTTGGNDIGYVPSLVAASLPAWIRRLPVLGDRLQHAAAPAQSSDRLSRTARTVGQVFAAIRDRAPSARIICVDYLTVLPPAYRSDLPFDEDAYHARAGLAGDLDTALARACSEHRVEIIKASEHSTAHHACLTSPGHPRGPGPGLAGLPPTTPLLRA